MKHILTLLTALVVAPLSLCAESDLKLASLFSDHMVMQRDQAAPVWGWANPGDKVTVEFAGQKKSTQANAEGQWMVRLNPLKSSANGRELIVQSKFGNQKVRVGNVVVGDVWLCSGQSNMHFRMAQVVNAQEEIAAADNPAVRFFSVEDQFAQRPTEDLKGVWQSVSPTTTGACSAVAYYFARDLQQNLGVPIGLVVSSIGGTRIETWMRLETLAEIGEADPLVEKWKKVSPDEFENIATAYRSYQHQRDRVHPLAVRTARAQGKPVPPEPRMPKLRCHDCPSALHCGMIAPLQPFAIRGAIWYQGESNSGQPASYEKLLPAMVADWRRVWGAELPFLFVQLAPHRNTHPAFREAQHRIWQKTPHTAMVVTIDVGDPQNIHPTRKRPVGERLALAARALSYGERVEYSGPVFKSFRIENSRAVVSFTHIGGGLAAKGGSLKGFTLAGPSEEFIAARAVIEGSNVVVTSDKILNPLAVRYAWAMAPDVNLFSREGLPAAPFRSETPAGSTDSVEPK
ncbi:MAG: sialate O-acetylesterase [Bythopirellula sp.]|nr:sialate O-acetylesterase [Bythopirellula sp.]